MIETVPNRTKPFSTNTIVESNVTSSTKLLEHHLQLCWCDDSNPNSAGEYSIAFVNYFSSDGKYLTAKTSDGQIFHDLTINKWVKHVKEGVPPLHLQIQTRHLGKWELNLERRYDCNGIGGGFKCTVSANISITTLLFNDTFWLQPIIFKSSVMPLLAITLAGNLPSPAVFHNLVVLAARFGYLHTATLECTRGSQGKEEIANWRFKEPTEYALAIYEYEADTFCLATTTSPSSNAKPICWFFTTEAQSHSFESTFQQLTEKWREKFVSILDVSKPSGTEIVSHLQELTSAPFPITVTSMDETPRMKVMAPRQDGIMCVLVPGETSVQIGIDFNSKI